MLKKISVIKPRLDNWNAKADKGQQLQDYLNRLAKDIGALQSVQPGLFLHMDIDVDKQDHFLNGHDLDNYLCPVVKHLGPEKFKFVSATKRIGGGSQLLIGQAEPLYENIDEVGWISFFHSAGSGYLTRKWKAGIRDALKIKHPQQLAPGPIEAQLVWRCSSGRDWPQPRNWVYLWKPTIDAMGPILGEPLPYRPFYPNDDRIVSLRLHLNLDDTMGYSVDVGMAWRPSPIKSCKNSSFEQGPTFRRFSTNLGEKAFLWRKYTRALLRRSDFAKKRNANYTIFCNASTSVSISSSVL